MGVLSTSFDEYTTGQEPADWSSQWGGSTVFTVEEDAAASDGKWLQDATTDFGLKFLRWDDVPDEAEQNVLAKVRADDASSTQSGPGVGVRLGGNAGSEDGYYAALRHDTSKKFRLQRVTNGALSTLGSTAFAWQADTFYWIRIEATGDTIRAKIWEDGDSEPGSWDISVTDTDHETGRVGVVDEFQNDVSVRFYDYFEAETPDQPPTTPTISVDEVRETEVDLSGTSFNDPQGDAHEASQWQVAEQGTSFASPDFDSGEDTSNLLSITADGLSQNTEYEARVRYKDDTGDWSEWSDAETFATGQPEKPEISIDGRDETTADLSGSDFADPQDDDHAASQWQVAKDGTDFGSPDFDSGEDSTNLTSVTATGLTEGTTYEARVRYKDDTGDWSLWSDPLVFETVEAGWDEIEFSAASGEWTNPNSTATQIDLLAIGAGGGGGGPSTGIEGAQAAGGGGAGGVLDTSVTVAGGVTIPWTIEPPGGVNQPGGDVTFWVDDDGNVLDPDTDSKSDAQTAWGGGEGGSASEDSGGNGGSGGGGGTGGTISNSGQGGGNPTDPNQGNSGGDGEGVGGPGTCTREGAGGGGGSSVEAGTDGAVVGTGTNRGEGGGFQWLSRWARKAGGGGDGGQAEETSCGTIQASAGNPGSGIGAGGGGGASNDVDGTSGTAGTLVIQFDRDDNLQPDKPTIECDGARDTEIDVVSSAFSDPDGDGHLSSQWQADVPEGDLSNPVHDSGEVTDDLEAHTVEGLISDRDYQLRVRHRDDSGFGSNEWSEWSEPVTCTTTGDSPCGDGSDHKEAVGDRQRVFFGESAGGGLFLHARVHEDVDSGTVVGEARTVPIAPAGVRGECHFARIVVVAETWTRGELSFTPIVDGEEITAEKQTVTFTGDGTKKHLHRWEFALSRTDSGGSFRYGMRGTWFQALFELKDLDGCGRVTITGVELEYEIVQERLPDTSFTGPTLELPSRRARRRWYFGEDGGGKLLEGDEGNDDDGTSVEALAETNVVAPAGFSGECVFRAAYFTARRANESALTLRFTPIVDDEELETVDVTLEALAGETVLEPRQVDFEQTYTRDAVDRSTYLPRGGSFRLRIETIGGLPSDRVELAGFELEYEVVSENLEASNA